jgi:hypothetical protein
MNLLYIAIRGALLAQDEGYIDPTAPANPLEHVAAQVRERVKNTSILDLWILLGVVLGAVALIYVLGRWNRRLSEPSKNPELLFRELCQAHSLSQRAISLVRSLASVHQQKPAMMFVMPELFLTQKLPDSLRSNAKEFQEIARHVFS